MNLFFLSDLCSFTETGRSFKKQDMYYCHTCKFANGEGICTNCVKKCHIKHNVKYAGFVNGFCDCGVKGRDKYFSERIEVTSGQSLWILGQSFYFLPKSVRIPEIFKSNMQEVLTIKTLI